MQRSLVSLIAGVVLALVAIGVLSLYVRSLKTPASATDEPTMLGNIVVAGTDLPFGEKLAPEQLKVVQWPVASVPKDAFHSIDEIFADAQGNDRIILRPMVADEPVLKTKISGFGAKATLSREVAAGMRAVSIRIDDVSGVAGFLLPGDRVDVLLTRHLPNADPNNNLVTDVILQNVTVLGIDQLSDQDRDKPQLARTATVQVTPEDAQKLALAQQAGTLSLALRSVDSTSHILTERVETTDLAATAKVAAAHHASGPGVRVIYGTGH